MGVRCDQAVRGKQSPGIVRGRFAWVSYGKIFRFRRGGISVFPVADEVAPTRPETRGWIMVDRRMAYEAYRKRTEIPRGLDYLTERLVRAVIRVQPKNVHEFAAQFFDGLLQQRDHGKYLHSTV
ncbi:unnamed protein product [Macrosiphum euphorbiae]|uniref:RIIa domain-containing protein n=1 Tax=Macrosiphum euphorbiae TaxID=13131 RepID=A0AAV0WV27_9HEMI|nr:unnamed protein product [Macrosiphum euphorbiae]